MLQVYLVLPFTSSLFSFRFRFFISSGKVRKHYWCFKRWLSRAALFLPSGWRVYVYEMNWLLFTLYFMYTRRTLWLFVFALLSMACKEEIPLVIAFFGLWSIVFQQRWRTGIGLVLLALGWLGLIF